MKRAAKREHLIEVAGALFNQYGYRATGIDQVIEASGVAKTTMYRHFGSKEELIVAVLNRIDEEFRNRLRDFVDSAARHPRDRLIASFDFLGDWFVARDFYGCPFVNAAGEYSDRGSPVFHAAVLHKRLMVAYFEELAHAAQFAEPKRIAEEINLLHEGAIAVAHVTGDANVARTAKGAAARLLADAGG